MQSLVNRECSRWALAEKGHQATPGAIETVVVWTTLANGLTGEQLNDVLAPAYLWTSAQLHAIHKALAAAWPSHNSYTPPLVPDLLAAQFLAHWRSSAVAQGHVDRDAHLAESLFQTKSRATFQPKFERLHMLAYDQAVRIGACTLGSNQALQHWLLSLVKQSPNLGKAFGTASSRRTWTAFGNLVIALGTHALGRPGAGRSEAERASQLNSQAAHLSANGDGQGALVRAREAVSIRRRLALFDPTADKLDLAMSLNNLAGLMNVDRKSVV